MSNVLIAYFSHDGEAYVNGKVTELETGNTRVAAGMLKELTGAEVYRIETVSGYPHSYMETIEIAKKEQQENARPALKGELPDMSGYSLLILAYPNWWGTMPMAVFHFLESCDSFGKTILPLCTHEGSGLGHSEADLAKTCPGAKVEKGLAITGSRVSGAKNQIRSWLEKYNII